MMNQNLNQVWHLRLIVVELIMMESHLKTVLSVNLTTFLATLTITSLVKMNKEQMKYIITLFKQFKTVRYISLKIHPPRRWQILINSQCKTSMIWLLKTKWLKMKHQLKTSKTMKMIQSQRLSNLKMIHTLKITIQILIMNEQKSFRKFN